VLSLQTVGRVISRDRRH